MIVAFSWLLWINRLFMLLCAGGLVQQRRVYHLPARAFVPNLHTHNTGLTRCQILVFLPGTMQKQKTNIKNVESFKTNTIIVNANLTLHFR